MNTIDSLQQVPLAAIAPLIVIQLILVVVALFSLARAERVAGPKWMWVIIILFGQLLGSIVYFIVGRRDR